MFLKNIEGYKSLNKVEIMLSKQELLCSFLSDYISETSAECQNKGSFLNFLWQDLFKVITTMAETITNNSKHQEKSLLGDLLEAHN